MQRMIFAVKKQKIIFDDFTNNTKEYGTFWTEMCPECYKKYKDIIGVRADDGGVACGTCSVEGCENEADYYVDFDQNEVQFD